MLIVTNIASDNGTFGIVIIVVAVVDDDVVNIKVMVSLN